jgi:hypothetical protein
MAGIEAEFEGEWDAFTVMTFLNPSLQWITSQMPEEKTVVHKIAAWYGIAAPPKK